MNDNSTNIQAGNGNADDRREQKRLADLKDFDPKKVDTSKVQIQDVTDQAAGGTVQIVGIRPPPKKDAPKKP